MPKNVKETVDLPDFVKESVAQIQILCTFQAHIVSQERLARNPCARSAWGAMRSDVAGERRSPKVISVSVDLLHKIFIYRKDELVKDLPAT
ncbi:MAG: hypothetical protein HXK52_01145 [Atopobium sp.]|nr:hypothetical protein [Atopobium sp.]